MEGETHMMLGRNGGGMVDEEGHRTRRRAPGAVVLTLMVALALTAAACGSSTPTINKAQAKTDISNAYNSLFHFKSGTLASKEAVIQNGSSLKGAMSQALASSEASAADGATVDTVTFLDSAGCSKQSLPNPCAKIKYDILGTGGTAILPGNTGYSVLSNGKWLVAKTTICTLLGLFYTAEGKQGTPAGC
jgi:hypothetical protein